MNCFLRLVTLGLILSLSLAAEAKQTTGGIYPNEEEITFTPQNGEPTLAYQGHVYVPENHNNSESRKIKIAYVRFPATGESKGSPIIYLSGGPGGSGIRTARDRRFPLFQALTEFGDVIALDQRGAGSSDNTERCFSSQPSIHIEKLTNQEIAKRYRLAARECLAKWQEEGIDIYGYTTEQNALDLDYLRQHFQAEKITLWGISYGSHLAFAATKLMSDRIERIIIASAEGLDQTVKYPARTDQYFAKIEALINASPEYQKQFPDLTQTMRQVHEQLNKEPISLSFNAWNKEHTILFQGRHMQMISSMVISDPEPYLVILLNIYYQLAEGNTDLLRNVLTRGFFTQDNISFTLMSLAMDLASGITDERLKRVNEQAKTSLLGDYLNFPMPHLNNLDPKLDLGDEYRTNADSDIPLLLFSGTLDGRTYPISQTEAVSGFSNMTQVMVENAGHNLYMRSPEVISVMKQFMRGDKITTDTIELPTPQFSMPQQ